MLGQSGIIYLQALPLGFFLLVAFPRYTGTLSFSMDQGRLGINENVAPGSISRLAKDDSTAMYVHFTSPNVPTIDTMYWRGLVLWNYSGGVWTRGFLAGIPEFPKASPAVPESNEVIQEITVKAHNQPWLFALDVPVTRPMNSAESPTWGVLLDGNIAQLSVGKLNHMARYDITSLPTPIEQDLRTGERDASLKLPDSDTDHIDRQVKELADHLHQGLSDMQESEYISAVLKYFRDGRFLYSTMPGVQGPDWLPVFLFQTKTGFCEHFASAFAVLMRLEHIPARLVVGYRGADYNPYSDDYVVLQSNAHAWDEVWVPSDDKPPALSQRGRWIRIDLTAPVSSGQLASSSGADAQDTLSSQIAHRSSGLYEDYIPTWLKDSMREMQLRRDQVESGWDNLVLSYDPQTQLRLAQALGFGQRAPIALLLSCFVAGGICVFIFRRWILRKDRVAPVESLYATFCHNMARRGIPRAAWEGPLAYTDRVAEAFPDDKTAIQRVGSLVAHARYGPTPADSAAHENLQSLLVQLTASQAATASRDRR
jgi:transglutaminase-like putative cysteine protease